MLEASSLLVSETSYCSTDTVDLVLLVLILVSKPEQGLVKKC